jgi:hypothetical protein
LKLAKDVLRDPYIYHAVGLLRGGAAEDEVTTWLVESLVRDRARLVDMAQRALERAPLPPLTVTVPGSIVPDLLPGYKKVTCSVENTGSSGGTEVVDEE